MMIKLISDFPAVHKKGDIVEALMSPDGLTACFYYYEGGTYMNWLLSRGQFETGDYSDKRTEPANEQRSVMSLLKEASKLLGSDE